MAFFGEYSIATRFMPGHEVLEPGRQLLAPGYGPLLARQPVEVVTLDGVHQPPGLAACRDEVIPSPRGQSFRRTRGPTAAWRSGWNPGSRKQPAVQTVLL